MQPLRIIPCIRSNTGAGGAGGIGAGGAEGAGGAGGARGAGRIGAGEVVGNRKSYGLIGNRSDLILTTNPVAGACLAGAANVRLCSK